MNWSYKIYYIRYAYNYSKEIKILKESTTNQMKYLAYIYESVVACRPNNDLEAPPIYSCRRKYKTFY